MAIRVLIVEDSPLMQRLLCAILGAHDDLKVAGVAEDPIDAREKIKQLKPDVITLDVEMPRMDGITFLERLMRLRPMPVVMVSSLTEANAEVTLRATARATCRSSAPSSPRRSARPPPRTCTWDPGK
jgi:two-component system chemotaxis response regulator CheB